MISRTILGGAVLLFALNANSQTFSFSFDQPSDKIGVAGSDVSYTGSLNVDYDSTQYTGFRLDSWSVSWLNNPPPTTIASTRGDLPVNGTVLTSDWPLLGMPSSILDLTIGIGTAEQKYTGVLSMKGFFLGGGTQGDKYSGSEQSFTVTVVPEPYEYGLIAVAGLIGWAAYDRRSRKQRQTV
ncbi:MAG TPA: hypothetical protein P5186_17545 [Candidatus Paceibacterota bacterium]|nr:hypothetical protein [Verrucomicrobiota bacterium]HRY49856.1 hypothetical protein [Candidatus Paceibacterota bacterium]